MTNNYYNKPGESYMDDLNYIGYFPGSLNSNNYNLNNGYNFSPYMEDNMARNQNYNTNYNYNYSFNPDYNQSINPNNQMQRVNSPEMFYPAIYRIIFPVVKSVIRAQNINYLNEKILNRLTEEVFNIVDGDVLNNEKENIDEKQINTQTQNTQSQTLSSHNQNNNNNHNQMNNQTNIQTSKQPDIAKLKEDVTRIRDLLVKDIIRILIIREIEALRYIMPNYIGRY